MIQAKKNIDEGQELNVNVHSTISSILDELDEDSIDTNAVDFDYDKESKKQELKEMRNFEINELLDKIDD